MAKGITVQEAQARHSDAGVRLGDRYRLGATGKGARWASGAGAAQQNYEQGVQASIAKKKFSAGVQAAGASAYDTGVQNKGVQNWGTGMQVSGDKYVKKVGRFASLWNQPLTTARGPRGSAANLKRMQENVERFSKVA